MALFSRQRSRARRVGLDKVQPPDMRPGAHRRHLKGIGGAVVVAALFAALLVLVMVFGRPALRYQVGDQVTADVRARVAFRFIDTEATDKARYQARYNTPNVYTFGDTPVVTLRASLVKVLDDLAAPETSKVRLDEIAGILPVASVGELALLKADLRAGAEASRVRRAVRDVTNELAALRIMSDERKAVEGRTGTVTVSPVSDGETPSVQLSNVDNIESARRTVERGLNARLLGGFGETAKALAAFINARLRPTLAYDERATRAAKDETAAAVRDVVVHKDPNDLLVAAPNPIGAREYDMLAAEQQVWLESQSPADWWKRTAGLAGLLVAAIALAGVLLAQYRPHILRSKTRLAVLGILVVVMVLAARGALTVPWVPAPVYLVPVAFAAMIVALSYDRRFACSMTLFIVLMVALATEVHLRPTLVLLTGGLVAAMGTHHIRKRTKLLKIGLAAGLAQAAVIYAVGLGQLGALQTLTMQASVGLFNGIACGFLITGLLPFLEPLFRITTDISLLELGDLNQPVLKSFALRAPGSYNHSLIVGVLAEGAARAIGADDLLARVGSYFHDIGKINKPQYFVENQSGGGSRHDRLSPQMSALVIVAHTKDGIELGRELGLPRPILDIITEHHGTTLVEYFYKRACEEAPEGEKPEDYVFRYPGPPPRSPEAAIVMLADSAESASRVLSDPTPARVRWLVREIAQRKLADGQLEECALTLRELHGIEESLIRGLISVFHGRIKY